MLLVMLPVVAAAAFYRKNNHFQTVIEFSTIVPVILGIAYAMSPIRRSTFRIITAAAIFEFAVLYLTRHVNYGYHIVAVCFLILTALLTIAMAGDGHEPASSGDSTQIKFASAISGVVILAMPIIPIVMLFLFRDGGLAILMRRFTG